MMASTRPGTLSRFGAQEPEVPRAWGKAAIFSRLRSRVISLIPTQLWPRLLVLFGVLCSVKMALLLTLGKHLFEAHWRVQSSEIEWIDYFLFAGFVLIGSLALARLAQYCRGRGTTTVRAANLVIVVIGLVFLFLTFHQGGNNYLYPILSHVVRWSSLGPYLADDLFFNPPFLVLWLAAYGFGYYCLVRTGQESCVLYLTAAFAAAYAPSFLGHLAGFRNELLVLNCLGLLSLISSFGSPARGHWLWFLLPIVWIIIGAGQLFCQVSGGIGLPLYYFAGLVGVTATLFGIGTVLSHRYGFSVLWARFTLFFAAAFLLLANTRYPIAPNFNRALCSAIEFPRYFLGELLFCALLGVVLGGVVRLWPRIALFCFDAAALLLMVLALVDFRLSQLLGVRLEWDVLAMGNSPRMMWRMARPHLPLVFAGVAGLVVLYFGALFILKRWWGRGQRIETSLEESGSRSENQGSKVGRAVPSAPQDSRQMALSPQSTLARSGHSTARWGQRALPCCQRSSSLEGAVHTDSRRRRLLPGLSYAAALFVGLGLLGLVAANPDKARGQAGFNLALTSPIWARATSRALSAQEFRRRATELGMGEPGSKASDAVPSRTRRDLNVVLVFMESSYNKHLSLFSGTEETQPLLSKYRDRMELFPNFFSDFASSIHARFAAFSSLYPVRDYNAFTLRRVPVRTIFEIMHDEGYKNSLFYSSYLDFTGFREFLANRGIDEIYDAESMPGQRHSEPVSWGLREEETLAAMRGRIQKYAADKERFFLTYVPAAPHYPYEKVPEQFHKFKPVDVKDYTPLYLNELLYMDWVLSSLVDQLKESNLLESTLVVITDDHGEMLGGKGSPIGHGWLLTPELANAPLIIMDPEKPGCQVNPVIGSQVDLLPTLLERLGIPLPTGQLYQGCSLDHAVGDRIIYLNTLQQYCLVKGNRMLFGDREAAGRAGESYAIENEGAKTIFRRLTTNRDKISIGEFDAFQEDLLRNYGRYAEALKR